MYHIEYKRCKRMVALTSPVYVIKNSCRDALIAEYAPDVPNASKLSNWKLNRIIAACLRDLFYIPKKLLDLIHHQKWINHTNKGDKIILILPISLSNATMCYSKYIYVCVLLQIYTTTKKICIM